MLPGVGVRHEFVSDNGQLIGVLVHHDGRREVLVYDREDSDACSSLMVLTHDDSRTLAELLGAAQVAEEVQEAQHEVEGQSISWIRVEPGGPVDGRTLATGEYRTKTGASVVAVMRGDELVPSPDADFVLRGGDMLVAVGPAAALDGLRALLDVTS